LVYCCPSVGKLLVLYPLAVTQEVTNSLKWEPFFKISQVISVVIKTITKFSNMIGYQQPDLSINWTVYASCL